MFTHKMPYVDSFQTLRERAGQRKASVAREAKLSVDTLDRIEKHQNTTRPTLIAAINALNALYYDKAGRPIDPDAVITEQSSFGG